VEKKKIEIYVALGLIVIFIAIIMMPKNKKKFMNVDDAGIPEVEGVQLVLESIQLIKKNKIDPAALQNLEDSKSAHVGGRNPFDILVQTKVIAVAPPEAIAETMVESIEPFPEVTVQGVVYAQDNPADSIVIINGEELKIGDAVDEWEIMQINDDLVMFKKGSSVHKLSLYEKQS
jgi:hypothetical protein